MSADFFELLLARAAWVGQDGEGVVRRVEALESELEGWPLLDWQARRLAAAVEGAPAPDPGALAEGLSPGEVEGLVAWP